MHFPSSPMSDLTCCILPEFKTPIAVITVQKNPKKSLLKTPELFFGSKLATQVSMIYTPNESYHNI